MLNLIFKKTFARVSMLALLAAVSLTTTAVAAAKPDFSGRWRLETIGCDNKKAKSSDNYEALLPILPPLGETLEIKHDEPLFTITLANPELEMDVTTQRVFPAEVPAEPDMHPAGNSIIIPANRTYYTDGQAQKQEFNQKLSIERVVRWQEDQLVVEERTSFGDRMIETYRLSSDNKRLFITTRLESNGNGRKVPPLCRIYNRVDAV